MAGRTLLLLRHAKSNWDDAFLDDFDRPLAKRGLDAAPRIGREMARRGWIPDMAIVSPALRTRQTWDLVAAELPRQPDAVFDVTIYEAQPQAILRSINDAPEHCRTLLVVGHNPGIGELAVLLAGNGSDARLMARMADKFPTAGLAVLATETVWDMIGPGDALLADFITPRTIS